MPPIRHFAGAALLAVAALAAGRAPALAADTPGVHALVNARIVTAPGRVIPRGTVVMRDGMITAVGANVAIPADARVWDVDSLTVYPGMIDAFALAPEVTRVRPSAAARAAAHERPGAAHELGSVVPEHRVAESIAIAPESLATLRAAGFAVAHYVPRRGIVRGASAVVSLADVAPSRAVAKADAAQIVSLETAGAALGTPAGYPGSTMGSVAVIRQAFLDAQWYDQVWREYGRRSAGRPRPETNVAWEALRPAASGAQPVFFLAHGMIETLRAAAIANEAKVSPRVVGAGDEYKRAKAIAATGVPLVVPVNFPDAPEIETADDGLDVTTEDLRHWNHAPGNPAALAKAGVTFALSAYGLKDAKVFRTNVGKAIARGLAPDVALAAVTTVPAQLLGLSDRLGTIAPGKAATLTVTRGGLFDEGSKVVEVWVDGMRQSTVETLAPSAKGAWDLSWEGRAAKLVVAADAETSVKVVFGADTTVATAAKFERERLRFTVRTPQGLAPFDLTATDERLIGTAGDGRARAIAVRAKDKDAKSEKVEVVGTPAVRGDTEAWRAPAPPQPAAVLVKNATIWTAGPQGTLENADLLVQQGRIARVGKGLAAPANAVVIDGTGKHVAPGIVDAHSHSAIVGQVNECTNAITAEVRVGDVVNSESVQIYRQLAGGTTVMHLLHGSCNAIGGQSALIKNRWGEPADRLAIPGAPPTIKFALGENPKRANFGAANTSRYPESRGGVEQVIRNAFVEARDYGAQWEEWRRGARPFPPRRDLQQEAVLEILRNQRMIHAHSYRQDEILMLARLTEEFGTKVQTFQHVLEGYKVADEMAAHGAGASSFSDWWAYKFEVIDAIPHNGYIMWDRGVNVSYNSDSNDLARRLNTEAAKAVKYGGVPPEEAIKFVTLNPAKQLRIENRVGSLEVGKDADFSIWTGSPLSTMARCEETWIEGRKYFDRDEDLAGRPALEQERAALVAAARKAAAKSGAGREAGRRFAYLEDADHRAYSCHEEEVGE